MKQAYFQGSGGGTSQWTPPFSLYVHFQLETLCLETLNLPGPSQMKHHLCTVAPLKLCLWDAVPRYTHRLNWKKSKVRVKCVMMCYRIFRYDTVFLGVVLYLGLLIPNI